LWATKVLPEYGMRRLMKKTIHRRRPHSGLDG
jgi:hypothetical protein